MQQVEQVAAPNAEAERLGVQIGIAQIQHAAAAVRFAFEADDACAARHRLVGQAELAQHGEAGGLKQQPRSDRAGFCEAFEDGDPMAGIGQQDCCGLAGDAATDDAYVENHHPATLGSDVGAVND